MTKEQQIKLEKQKELEEQQRELLEDVMLEQSGAVS